MDQHDTYVVEGGQLLSKEMMDLATEIKARYPNLGLAWIPPEKRAPEDDKHWAIVMNDSEGNITEVIKELSVLECHPNFVLKWLWENDSTRMDPWEKMLKIQEKEAEAREKANKAVIEEQAELIHDIQKSPLHYYTLPDGRKLG